MEDEYDGKLLNLVVVRVKNEEAYSQIVTS